MRPIARTLVAVMTVGTACGLDAQTLTDRVAGAAQPRVQFTYSARADVCGDGRAFIRVSNGDWYGSIMGDMERDACAAGPARVVLDRAGREVVSLQVFAGPVAETPAGVTDLGRVRARDAAEYLLGLAERSEGRVSRDAILPAMLADSVELSPRLLAIARNQNAARQTRSTAISWLGRQFDGQRAVQDVAAALVAIARDDDDNQNVRQQALRTLARLEHGAGTTALMDLSRDPQRTWLAREALSAISASGDARARQHLREVVRQADAPDDVLASAVRVLGGEYATGADLRLIRETYARLPGEKSREAAMSAIASFGGSDNVAWMLTTARDANQPVTTRRRAVQHAYRGGTPLAEIIKLYDETTDTQIKDAVMNALSESGERQAADKLMQIARSDPAATMRRKAINILGRSSDERVKRFLSELAER